MSDQAVPYVMLGAGGHARVLQETLAELGFEIRGYLAPTEDSLLGSVPWLGGADPAVSLDPESFHLVNGVGSVAASSVRHAIFRSASAAGFSFASVIDPSSIVRPSVVLGHGVQILARAFVNSDAVIGDNSLINSAAIVEHHVRVGSHVHVSPGAVIGGGAAVGDRSHIGLGATVLQGVSIGKDCTIGAGAVVIRDMPDGVTAVGVPAIARRTLLS